MSKIMELNLANDMEVAEKLHMRDDGKHDKERKLSFTRNLFNGALIPRNVRFPM